MEVECKTLLSKLMTITSTVEPGNCNILNSRQVMKNRFLLLLDKPCLNNGKLCNSGQCHYNDPK